MGLPMMRRSIAFARSFAGYAGLRAATAFAFVLAGAALEGIGILLLIPVLDLVIGQPAPSESGLLQRAATWLGLEQKTDQLVVALAGFLLLLALRGWMIWARDIRLMQLSLGFVDHWRTRLFRALTEAPWATSAKLARAHRACDPR
jgi:ATP-binding cassette subfamily C protein